MILKTKLLFWQSSSLSYNIRMARFGVSLTLHFGANRRRKRLDVKVARVTVGSTQVGRQGPHARHTRPTITAENRHVLPPLGTKT